MTKPATKHELAAALRHAIDMLRDIADGKTFASDAYHERLAALKVDSRSYLKPSRPLNRVGSFANRENRTMAKKQNAAVDMREALDDNGTPLVTLPMDMVLECTIARRNGDGKVIQAKLGDFPANAIERILRYGFQRIFNDRVGGSDSTAEDKVKDAEAMIARFKAGTVGRQPKVGLSAVEAEFRKLVRAKLTKEQREKLKDRAEDDTFADDGVKIIGQRTFFAQMRDKNPALWTKAEENVAARGDSPAVVMDGVDL